MFSEKLDYVMELTNTKASSLGNACRIAPAHVSRLRSGARPLPKRPAFLHDLSLYLAKRVTADYQRRALCDALRLPAWPSDEETAASTLEQWFLGAKSTAPDIAPLLARFADPRPGPIFAQSGDGTLPKPRRYYYGPQGKQEAVLQFFDLILKEKSPQTLYLASDEEIGWLYEDPAFSALWLQRFIQVLAAGSRVKIIHSIGRNMNEMLEAVAKWLPVYTTGAVEPYFYPKLRDGIFQRTLFLAPGTAAVTSVSVGQKSAGRLNELITDKEALAALAGEYEDFLALCRPLMQIITLANREDLWRARGALLTGTGDVICMSDRPTLTTMPQRVAKAMQERAPEGDLLRQWRAASGFIRRLKEGGSYTEILPPRFESASAQLPCADLLGAPGLSYTFEEWQAHTDSAARFGDKHPGCRTVTGTGIPANISLIARENRGVIMTKTDAPGVAFAISEPSMVHSFWSYLSRWAF